MKYASLILLVIGLLLTVHGVSVIEGVGFDVARFFLSVETTTRILPLAVGIVLMVTSVAGFLPATQEVAQHSTGEAPHSLPSTKRPD
jgi:hypothetical protein